MPIYISATLIQDYLACPQKVYYRINQPEDAIKNDDMLVGSIVHEVIEKYWNDEEVALQILNQQLDFFNLHEFKRQKALNSVDVFFRYFRPFVSDGDEIEYKFKLPLEKNVFLIGKMDRISNGNIFDWKTSTTTPKSISNDIQFLVYAEAYRRIFKKEPTAVYYASLNSGKLISLPINKTLTDEVFNTIIPSVIKAVKFNDYYRKGMFTSGCFGCSYKEVCFKELKDGLPS